MRCGFREVSRFVKTTRIHLKQATYLHCTVEIGHFALYPVRLKSISDPFKNIRNETIYQCDSYRDLGPTATPSGEVIKIQYSYSEYNKNLVIFARRGFAPPTWNRARLQRLKEMHCNNLYFGLNIFWYFLSIIFQLFTILCLVKDHWRWFSTLIVHMVHIFMPPDRMIGAYFFVLSVCLFVCLSVCLLSTLTVAITFEP